MTADRPRAWSGGIIWWAVFGKRGRALNPHNYLHRQRLGSGVPVVKTIGSIQGRCKFFVRKTCQQPSKRHLGSLVSNSDGHRVGVPSAQQVSPTRKNASGLAPRLCVTGECPAGGRLENLSGKGCGRGAQGRRRPAVGYCRGWTSPLPRRFKARPWDRGAHNWERGASSVSRGNKAKAEPGADSGRNTTAFRPLSERGWSPSTSGRRTMEVPEPVTLPLTMMMHSAPAPPVAAHSLNPLKIKVTAMPVDPPLGGRQKQQTPPMLRLLRLRVLLGSPPMMLRKSWFARAPRLPLQGSSGVDSQGTPSHQGRCPLPPHLV